MLKISTYIIKINRHFTNYIIHRKLDKQNIYEQLYDQIY